MDADSATALKERRQTLWPTRMLRHARFQIEPEPPSLVEVSAETRRAFLSGETRCWVSATRLSSAERGILDLPEPDEAAVFRALRTISEQRLEAVRRIERERAKS